MKNIKSLNKELLSKRVFFRTDDIRNKFFAKLKTRFGNWVKIRNHFGIYKSRLENLRNGTLSLPYKSFIEFLSYFSEKEKQYFLNEIMLKDKNWGRSKGGTSTYKKHKYLFEKGRKIGATKTSHISKYHFKFDMPLTTRLCELIGAFIGDGFTNKYGAAYMIQYTGHARLDREYIIKTIQPIIKEISPCSNPIITEKENTIRLTVYSKEFHNLLTKRFHFPAGKKSYIVAIPDEIVNSKNPRLINSCIRGIFDTDGCVFTDKRASYRKPYFRINLSSMSISLIEQVYNILGELKVNPRKTTNYQKQVIQINGLENVKKFIKEIGFSNKRHLNKIMNL